MLEEGFVVSSVQPPSLTSGTAPTHLKDATVFLHSYRPHSKLEHTLKKSSTGGNALAVSATHIFAVQQNKATVHVYGRDKHTQELTVPFPERLKSCTLACNNSVLCLGTDSGSMYVWELATGRTVSLPPAHIQPVTHLAADRDGLFLLSGAADSNVFVWSLLDILSFSNSTAEKKPRESLSAHTSAITALALGHGAGPPSTRLCATAAADSTVILWSYATGTQLRSFLLSSPAISLVLDPVDRAMYTGYDDGSVSCIPFHSSATSAVFDITQKHTPIQPPPSSRWAHSTPDAGAAQALALNYEGSTLLSAHASGKVCAWSVGDQRYAAEITEYAGANLTNLHMLYPLSRASSYKTTTITKPRVGKNALDQDYLFTTHLLTPLAPLQTSFSEAVLSTGFPLAYLQTNPLTTITSTSKPNGSKAKTGEEDYMSLSVDESSSTPSSEELVMLRTQLATMKKQQTQAKTLLKQALEERAALKTKVQTYERREKARVEKRQRKVLQQFGDDHAPPDTDGDEDEESDSDSDTGSSLDVDL